LNYYYFNRALAHFQFEAQTGSFYKSVSAKARIDLPFYNSSFIEPEISYNNWDYLEGEDLLRSSSQTILKRFDRKVGINIGWPLGSMFKMTLSAIGFNNIDRYVNTKTFVSTDTLDELKLKGVRAELTVSLDDLNRKQYPSAGKSYRLSASFFDANEQYTPGNTSTNPALKRDHQWLRVRATAQHFFTNRGLFRIGYYADAVFSNQPFFRNYSGTIVNAPGFLPFQDSPTLILENFRSFNYIAGGLKNIFSIRSRLDFRVEGYIFKPIVYILEGSNQEALSNEDLTAAYFAGTAGVVLHSPVGPISLSVNYYDDVQNQWGALLHVGFLLFNRHSVAD
jgi:NTE family protein